MKKKILWITNIVMPEAESLLGKVDVHKGSGGWLIALSSLLLSNPELELAIASVSSDVDDLVKLKGEKNVYYIIPYGKGNLKYNKQYEKYWKRIENEYKPDIVHIHGTEFSHGLAYVTACGNSNVIVSIQGIVNEIARFSFYQVPIIDYMRNWQLSSLIKNEKRNYLKRAESESKYFKLVDKFIGRTDWDKAYIASVNTSASYFHCGEILRESFYKNKWDINNIERYSIFMSQANSSIKGLHQAIKAIRIVKDKYPDVKLYVAGDRYFTLSSRLKKILRCTTYNSYIKSLIRNYELEGNIVFLPALDEKSMCERFKKSHVFIMPSSIENSSNSLGEALLLGVPSIASFVGGTSNLIEHGKNGFLYRFEDHIVLAYYITLYFSNDDMSLTMSSNSRKEALVMYNPQNIINQLLNIYKNGLC